MPIEPRPEISRRMLKAGTAPSRLTASLAMLPGEKHRAWLIREFGPDPDISVLPDDTPIEVLALYRSTLHGWKYRVRMLRWLSSIETLGDLRNATDDELRKCPNVGVGTVRELRKFCPYRKRARGRRK